MWPFSRTATKENLQQWKRIKINGWAFTIRKLNPLLDFPGDKMPGLFTDIPPSRRGKETVPVPGAESKTLDNMRLIISKGVVSPVIAMKEDNSTAICVDDLFRDGDTAARLYIEIVAYSLTVFRGVRGLFFWAKIRQSLYTEWEKSMAQDHPKLSSEMAKPA